VSAIAPSFPLPSLVLAAIDPRNVLVLAAVLFGIGLVGVACRRNVLVILLSVEILLNAANLAFVAFSKIHGNLTGQVFVFFAMAIAAAEVAVGLAIVIAVYRLRRVVDANAASDLRERHLGQIPPIEPEGKDAPHAHDDHATGPDAGHHDAGHHDGGHDAHAAAAPVAHGGGH
jgi:NADH-quinone oxidoreductase subunit K